MRPRAAPPGRPSSARWAPRAPFVAHPWPVTPYHDDYVQQYDLAQRARERAPGAVPTVRATGALARALAAGGITVADGADAVVEEITLPSLLDGVETRLAGWHGPPWLKEGWFQAWLLQAPALPPAARREAEDTFRRRTEGGARTAAERINLERRLVAQATSRMRARGAGLHGAARGARRGVLGGHREHRRRLAGRRSARRCSCAP